MIKENFIKLFEESFQNHWDLPALTDYSSHETLSYQALAIEVAKLHMLFDNCNIRRGDKIAILGRNTPKWCTAYIATVTYGAIIVPILQDFNPNDIHHIINHSDSTLLFISDNMWDTLEEEKIEDLRGVISLNDYHCLSQRDGENISNFLNNIENNFNKKYPGGFTKEDIKYAELANDKIILINYTSGTTGFSKGVMLTGNNLAGNIMFGIDTKLHFKGSEVLSFLPLAHAYGCAFDFLSPLCAGTHVTLLGKTPSPKILLKAFEEIKPNLICCVPLVLEKIYRKQILPLINKKAMKIALNIPILDTQINAQICKKLIGAFGGRFEEIIIGGAPMNAEVEAFLHKIKFPFTIGYGMTECGPLISYAHWSEFIPTSAGRCLPNNISAKILSPDPENIAGEILIKGENVMAGYYKNPVASADVLDEDGWLHTGDMGTLSHDNTIFIRGRSKTMILGANGQNIYPEEIESKLNNMPFVMESLVIEKNGKLEALIYPDYEAVDNFGITPQDLPLAIEEVRQNLNKMVAPYETITSFTLFPNEFEKTPKKSIKRYLYTNK